MYFKITSVIGVIALLSACTSVRVDPVSYTQQQNFQDVCIVNNTKVIVKDFVPTIQKRLMYHGVRSRVIDANATEFCQYRMEYTAKRSWDLAPYLSSAELRVYQNQAMIAQAEYHLRGQGGLALNKFSSVESKMNPVVDKLLGR